MSDVDVLVGQAVDYCLADGLLPADAAEKAFADDDREAVRFLAVAGLASLVSSQISDFRKRGTDAAPENDEISGSPRSGHFQHRTQPEEAAAGYYWLSKPYETDDGRLRAVYEFSLDDWQFNADRFASRLTGIQVRHDFFHLGLAEMEKRAHVKSTKGLPKKVLEVLETAAGQAFRGGAVVV